MTVKSLVVTRQTEEKQRHENGERRDDSDKIPVGVIRAEEKLIQPRRNGFSSFREHCLFQARNVCRLRLLDPGKEDSGSG